ncbi:hypothetical protein [Lactobacillus crispatus]|uniref:hypothetical protein n=1 Tax=Lactobacillus crispatus TaxID=47770 RepID=UPI0011D224C3|nr:hypothetical protein [Lactobacillus crispatus]
MNDKILKLQEAKPINTDSLSTPHKKKDNIGGGEPPMSNDKYVTHEELNHAVDKLDAKIDLSTEKLMHHVDNKFNENNVDLTDRFNENKTDLTSKFSENKSEIASLKKDLKANNEKLAWIVGILSPILTTIILKFLHLS